LVGHNWFKPGTIESSIPCILHHLQLLKHYSAFPHFSKTIFHTFSILREKTLIPSLIFVFPKYYSWNTMTKTSTKLPSLEKNKIW